MAVPEIQKIETRGLNLNCRIWGPKDGHPVLAMHGWMDNAASFDLLAPLLPDFRIVAVDFPGHGFSDYFAPYTSYNTIDVARQMVHLVNTLGWSKFSIMGHSLGGIIGEILAAIMPERIHKVALIDVFGAVTQPSSTILMQLRKHVQSETQNLPHTVFISLEEAAKMRVRASFTGEISLASARILAEGGMIKVPNGYSWATDSRQQFPMPVMLSDEQLKPILEGFVSDCVVIYGTRGIVESYSIAGLTIETFTNVRVHKLAGGHHIHLDDAQGVANIILPFFKERPSS
jgi:pimeloyl-ACP methyl ester carboxylesterase